MSGQPPPHILYSQLSRAETAPLHGSPRRLRGVHRSGSMPGVPLMEPPSCLPGLTRCSSADVHWTSRSLRAPSSCVSVRSTSSNSGLSPVRSAALLLWTLPSRSSRCPLRCLSRWHRSLRLCRESACFFPPRHRRLHRRISLFPERARRSFRAAGRCTPRALRAARLTRGCRRRAALAPAQCAFAAL